MARPRPAFLRWTGEVFTPEPAFVAYCSREFQAGAVYPMIVDEQRSQASQGHYFAALKEAFNNLSEENARQFPSSEHLRAWALVQSGYAHETNYVMASPEEARKLASGIRLRSPYAVISVKGNVVQVWDAESQSKAAMRKDRFEKSKQDVLDLVASMSRTTASQLNHEARRHGR